MSIIINSTSGNIVAGGNDTDGDLQLKSNDNRVRIHLDGNGGNAWLGANGADGDLILFPASATNNNNTAQATVQIDGAAGNIWLGGNGVEGDLVIFPNTASSNSDTNQASVHIDGQEANIWMGGNGRDGDIVIFPSSATNNHDTAQASIHLDGNAGDITLRNADFAEDFDILPAISSRVEPGTVMVLTAEGNLNECAEAYDKKVAGVISGAGKYRPGIVMDKQPDAENRLPVALSGKVMCKVDAAYGPIEVGDLITTSPTPGHAMKASDPSRAFGAVIGKAMGSLDSGTGFVPILVSLQ